MKQSYRIWLVILAVAVIGVVLMAPLQMMPFGRDQGLYVAGGEVIAEGGSLYRDVFTQRPPGVFAWFAAVRVAMGPLEEDARATELAWMVLACLLAGLLVYEWTDRNWWAALLAGSLLALRHVSVGFAESLQPERLAALPFLLALCFWGRPGAGRHIARALATGLVIGAGSLFDWAVGAAVPVLVLVELVEQLDTGWRTALRDSILLLAGCLLVLVGYAGWLWLQGSWDLFVQAQSARWIMAPRAGFVDVAAVLAAVLLLLLLARNKADRPVLLLTTLLGAGMWLAADAHARQGVLAAPLALIFGLVAARAADWFARRIENPRALPVAAALLCLIFILAGPWLGVVRQWGLFTEYLGGKNCVDLGAQISEPALGFDYPAVREAAGVLERNAQPDWRLFVWGDEPGFYHYTGLKPAGPFLELPPFAPYGEWYQQEILAMLTDHPPEMVALIEMGRRPFDRREVAGGLAPGMHVAVAREVGAQYTLLGQVAEYRLYRRSDLDRP